MSEFKEGDKVEIISRFEKCRAEIGTIGIIKCSDDCSLRIKWLGTNNHCMSECLRGLTNKVCSTGTYNLPHIRKILEHNRNGANKNETE